MKPAHQELHPAIPSAGDTLSGADFLALPGGSWRMWRTVVLRSAGFAVRLVDSLGDAALADAADRALTASGPATGGSRDDRDALARYEGEFTDATVRLHDAVESIAEDGHFREAVTWQNPAFLRTCVDRRPASGVRNNRTRRRETAIASYLQRYTTKNDSIGYFGPVGWASWLPSGPAAQVRPGERLLSRRTVYFESWAMDAVAAAFAARPELAHALPPRVIPANHLDGETVHLPVGPPVALNPHEAALLRLCDGVRTVREVSVAHAGTWSAESEQEVLGVLRGLEARGVVLLDMAGPIDAFPERLLRRRLLAADPVARDAALRDLDRLLARRETLAAAAGDPVAVGSALDELNQEFERITGVDRTRLHGQTYAGRTIVYEDTVRDVEVGLGPALLERLGPPLTLVLDSARWLASRVEQDCAVLFEGYYERRRRRTGSDQVPLAALLALATRDFYTATRIPPVAGPARAELRRRWARVLAVPPGLRRYQVRSADIADAVAQEFGCTPPSWVGGLTHSPDLMVTAASAQALAAGDCRFVLGELHTAFNSVESRAVVEQSPDRTHLLAMAEAVGRGRRVMLMAPRAWGSVTARTSPPSALLSAQFTYWAVGGDDVCDLPSAPMPVAALTVGRGPDGLVVTCGAGGLVLPLAEVLGDYLSGAVVNTFGVLPTAPHTPRVTIDDLVVARETWRMPARRLNWVFQLDERRRYLQMRAWLRRHGIPRHAFYSVSVETKPAFVDFTSIPLVNALAGVVRRMAEEAPDDDITLSEMLPDTRHAWLPGPDGKPHTCELRFVVTEGTR